MPEQGRDPDMTIRLQVQAQSEELKRLMAEIEQLKGKLGHGLTPEVHRTTEHFKLFGMSHRQVHMAMHGLGREIPGLNLALRMLGGGAFATMAAFMAFGQAVEKIQERFKELSEEYKKFSEEAAKPVLHTLEANKKAFEEAAREAAQFDVELAKITGHQKTLAERTKEAEQRLREEAKAETEIRKSAEADEMAMLEEMHQRKLISEDDFLREKTARNAKFRQQELAADLATERKAVEEKEAALKEWESKRDELFKEHEAKAKQAGAAKAALEALPTREELKGNREKLAVKRDEAKEVVEAYKAGNIMKVASLLPLEDKLQAATGVGGSYAVFQKYQAKEAEFDEAIRKADLEIGQNPTLRAQRITDSTLAEGDSKAATDAYSKSAEFVAQTQTELKIQREAIARKQATGATVEKTKAGTEQRAADLRTFDSWMAGGAVTSDEKARRMKAIMDAQEKGTISPETAARLLELVRAVPDAPSRNQMRKLTRMKFDQMSFPNQASRDAAYRSAAAFLPVSQNYGQVYRMTDRELRAAGVPGFAEGGYTGDGPPGEVKGVVHSGEFVLPADFVGPRLPELQGLKRAGAFSDPRNPFNIRYPSEAHSGEWQGPSIPLNRYGHRQSVQSANLFAESAAAHAAYAPVVARVHREQAAAHVAARIATASYHASEHAASRPHAQVSGTVDVAAGMKQVAAIMNRMADELMHIQNQNLNAPRPM